MYVYHIFKTRNHLFLLFAFFSVVPPKIHQKFSSLLETDQQTTLNGRLIHALIVTGIFLICGHMYKHHKRLEGRIVSQSNYSNKFISQDERIRSQYRQLKANSFLEGLFHWLSTIEEILFLRYLTSFSILIIKETQLNLFYLLPTYYQLLPLYTPCSGPGVITCC